MTSTILSLILVPVVYEFVDDFERWLTPRLARLVTPRHAAAPVGEVAPQDAP
jgi:HAE1 family hydrophobic/amphiphilic exporter-1